MGLTRIQLRYDTAADWTSNNPTLAEGEIGIEIDTNKIKIGDGATAWTTLAYFAGSGGLPNPFALPADLTPAQITADVNDYNPTGLSTSDVLRLDVGGGNWNITGLAGGADGRIVILVNISAGFNLTLVNQSVSSAAANRFAFNAGIVIRPQKVAVIIYDATTARWRLFASGNADALQGAKITSGLGGSIQNNELLIYNAGDAALEPIAPADLASLMGAVLHSLATAANDFLVASGAGAWVKKTLAETITILRTSLDSIFAPIAKGVTNGDAHNHVGGDGAALTYSDVLGANGNLATVPASSTYYIAPWGGLTATGGGTAYPIAGTLLNFRVLTANAQPASGSLVFTLQIAGVDKSIVVTVPAGGGSAVYSDVVNTAAVLTTQGIRWKVQNNATAASAQIAGITLEISGLPTS